MSDISRDELIAYLQVFNPRNYADAYYESLNNEQLQAMYNELLEQEQKAYSSTETFYRAGEVIVENEL